MIQIRKANQKDIENINQLFYETNLDINIADKYIDFTVCVDKNELLGCGCGIIENEAIYINSIIVKNKYRKQKIGSSIVKAILNAADLSGVKEAYMSNELEAFATYLRFEKLQYDENKSIFDKFNEIYNSKVNSSIFTTKLEGYFKPCCCK